MISHTYVHRVRYRECDPMGVVYHTHYLDYFEAARTEALRELGLAYKELESRGVLMPVVDLAVKYRRPAYYDDLLAIRSIVTDVPGMRLTIRYEVTRRTEAELLTTGHVSLCFVDAERNRPIPAPEAVASLFRNALNEAA